MAHAKGPNPWDQDESTVDESTAEEGVAAAGNLTGLTGKQLRPVKPDEWNA